MASIETVDELEDLLSQPSRGLIEMMRRLSGDLIVLGVGGKMGPTLARMARRATESAGKDRRIFGASRFSSPQLSDRLRFHGIEPIAIDLLDRAQLATLPEVPNVIFMAGMKFGGNGNESLAWAMNCWLPGLICERYRDSRIVVFSTGNVYGLTPVKGGGSTENSPLNPLGDYAMSCVGRERMFDHFSRTLRISTAIIRLNYATEMRYGVLVDLARRVWTRQPVDVAMGYVNVIWQAEASAMALQALDHANCPPFILNVAGPETLRVRDVAARFGEWMGREVRYVGEEAADALLNDGRRGHDMFGEPCVSAEMMTRWIADWVMHGREDLGKPTHFQTRDGKF